MNVKRVLLIAGVALLAAALFLAGTAFAQSGWGDDGWDRGHMNGWDEGRMRGWMNGWDNDHMSARGGHHGAMMGGWGGLVDVAPLTLDEAESAVADFLAESDDANLAVGEVMIFENHAYAQVVNVEAVKAPLRYWSMRRRVVSPPSRVPT
jgi:hypothetical protein